MSQAESMFIAPFNGRSYAWYGSNTLTEKGRSDVDAIRTEALSKGLITTNSHAYRKHVILTSVLPPARQIGERLAEGTRSIIVPSKRIAMAGDTPHSIQSLDETVRLAYEEETGSQLEDATVIIVASAAMAGIVRGNRNSLKWGDGVPTDQLTEYALNTWPEDVYNANVATHAEVEFGLQPQPSYARF